jgi:hypothetical protein
MNHIKINTKSEGDYPYMAFYSGKVYELYAKTKYDGLKLIGEHLKLRPNKLRLVAIELAEES